MHVYFFRKRSFLALGLLLWICVVQAQKAPMKFGKVDQADLQMKVYPADTSAAAVMLCNFGYFDSRNFQFVHQVRIKVLKEEGKSWGDFIAPAAENAIVKGQTVNLENGAPVVSKLKKESIFIERITKGRYRARVAMPNVKVGSVIDLEICYVGLPSYWRFQESIPMRWSELIIEPNTYLTFRKNFFGYIPISESSDYRWVTKDVPAFKSEPYVDNSENYLSRFDIEVSVINIPGVYYKEYATTWEAVAETLRRDEDFGQHLSGISIFLNGLEKQIKAVAKTPEERLAKAFDEVKKIKWNKKESIWPSGNSLSTALNKKIGNNADINLILILLLRKLDIDANPLVLSTRDNGVLPPYSVSFDKLNYVIAHAVIGDQSYNLDATEENLPLDMLPERDVNGRGLLITKNTLEWINLTALRKDKSMSMFNLKLTTEGLLKGEWSRSNFDYAALDQRNHYKTFNSQDEYLKSIENKHIGLSIDKYEVIDMDSLSKPLNENFSLVLKNGVTKTNNQFFINPALFEKWTENPFKLEERLYPVDFVTPIEKTQVFLLELPQGYQVEQLPQNIKMALPENAANFQMQSVVNENSVQVLFKLNINKPVFLQKEYLDLKAFFDQVVKKQSEMLIIKKV